MFQRIALFTVVATATASPRDSSWYTRYESYPNYCSTTEQMDTRAIPPLTPSKHVGDSRLVHVTSIIRHGARTPWSSDITCWDGFWSDTDKWDCDLKTFVAPPDPWNVEQDEGWTPAGSDAMFLFAKTYDALHFPEYNLRNDLNGTCQKGQLLMQGYEQSLKNGEHLKDAYVYDGSKLLDHDITMRLLDLSQSEPPPYQEPTLYFRSDDDQRTIMSGQVLLRGLFGTQFVQHLESNGQYPVIPLHIADRDRDILDADTWLCPKLGDLWDDALSSREWQDFNHSKEATTIRHFLKEELGGPMVGGIDCLMTTMCTDRELPHVLNDYNMTHDRRLHNGEEQDDEHSEKWGDNLFQRILDFETLSVMIPMLFDDAAYAKLAMGPLWAEILERILPIVSPENSNDRSPPDNRLAVFSGHDSTILPLLATLGPNVWDSSSPEWTPYASMLLLEVHEFIDGQTDKSVYPSDYGFRLVYNGKVLTDRMEGCPKDHDLCDMKLFLDRILPIAARDRDCAAAPKTDVFEEIEHSARFLTSSWAGFMFALALIALSAAGGAVGMHYHLTQRMPWTPVPYDEVGVNDLHFTTSYQDDPTSEEGEGRIM